MAPATTITTKRSTELIAAYWITLNSAIVVIATVIIEVLTIITIAIVVISSIETATTVERMLKLLIMFIQKAHIAPTLEE